MAELLRVNNLATHFRTEIGTVRAVDGVSYHIDENEIVGVVGESGCGKSVTQLSVMQLIVRGTFIPSPPGGHWTLTGSPDAHRTSAPGRAHPDDHEDVIVHVGRR